VVGWTFYSNGGYPPTKYVVALKFQNASLTIEEIPKDFERLHSIFK
jgi:hypothetical protein